MDPLSALDEYIGTSPDILGGTPVFKGTRVPVGIMFDYFQGGDNMKEFLENYPSVKESIAQKVLELLSSYLIKIKSNDTAT